jgi:hypothetical protein
LASTPERQIEQLAAELAETRLALDSCRASLQLSRSALCAVADGLAITDLQGRIS